MNLFVVRTPLQCFNATEARDRFHAGEDNRLLVYYGTETDRQLIAGIIDDRWHDVHWLAFGFLGKRSYGVRLAGWLRRLGPVDTLYVGLVTHVPLHVANRVQPARLRLIDDGNETLLVARRIQHLRAGDRTQHPKWRDRLFGLDLDPGITLRLEAFSLYDTTPYGVPCIHNDYRGFRARAAALPERQCVIFIGSNLVGTYFRDEAAFLACLARARDHFAGHELLYCPHRYEDTALRAKIAALGIALFEPGTILEQAFVRACWRPALLASFRSTAIDTLGMIYGIPGCMLRIPRADIVDDAKAAELEAVWADYRQRGGRLIDADQY